MICPAGIPNCCLYDLWAFPILIFHTVPHMTCGHQYALLAYPHGHQYALWALCPVGIPISICPVGFPNKGQCPAGTLNAFFFSEGFTCHDMPCGHSQLLLICPVGIPNPHISFYASYVLWSSVSPVGLPPWPPICPVGIFHSILPWAHSHMPRGHSQQALMSHWPPQRFLFQRRLNLPWYALRAYPIAAYMPCGHSQSSHFTLCPICPVVISTLRGLTPMTTNMPRGHFLICPVGVPIPISPVGIANKH